jgi:hypothetical protein
MSQSFASPLITSRNNANPSTANAIILPSRSPPNPVDSSLLYTPLSVATASATYPLIPLSVWLEVQNQLSLTYGLLLGVSPPVGPAVPDSQIVYVLPTFALTLLAIPATISVVGPLYTLMFSSVQPANAMRDSRVYS